MRDEERERVYTKVGELWVQEGLSSVDFALYWRDVFSTIQDREKELMDMARKMVERRG